MNKIKYGLYAITNGEHGEALERSVSAALKGGATLLQYRNKNPEPAQRLHEAQLLKKICAHYQVPFLINDDIRLAKAINADGIHIGQKDTDLHAARRELGENAIIGVTCHSSIELAQKAQDNGADYVALGCCFPSLTKPHALPLDWNALREASKILSVPIVGIGGITLDNCKKVLEAGAHIIAVVNDLFHQNNVEAQARAYTQVIQEFHHES